MLIRRFDNRIGFRSQGKVWINSYSGLSNQSLLFWSWMQNFPAKLAASHPHNVTDSCTIPHLIRTHFSQTRRGSEKVITGDRVTKRQDIRSSCEPCNRTIVVTSAREWQQCSHPAPPQCCRSACSCTLTTCGLLGHVMALPCQDRDRDWSRSGNSGSTGAIHTNRAHCLSGNCLELT